MRVVPRANEAINETWIADRDRFSCEGLYSDDRARAAARQAGRRVARGRLGDRAGGCRRRACRRSCAEHGAAQLGVLASPISTLEELYLTGRDRRAVSAPSTSTTGCAAWISATRRTTRSSPTLGCSHRRARSGELRCCIVGSEPAQGSAADRAPRAQGGRAAAARRRIDQPTQRYELTVPDALRS